MTGFYKDYSDSSDTHQNSAEASADAAEVSATGAATSASEAATSASESATSASEALVSENNASTSESNASTSASNASTSESNASTSASNASTDADDAEDSATQAAASAVAASNHATTAGQSAISASNSASSILNLTVADGATGSTASYDAATGVLTIPVAADGEDGEDGNVYIGSYDENTGVVGFINSNGANFSTGDLRGADGSDATVTTSNVTAAGAAMLTGATFTGNVAVDHNLLYVDTTEDKVGVGTASPQDKLHVNGTLRATDLYVTGGESYLCRTHSTTDQSLSTLRLCAISTGDMTDGFGTGITFDAQDNSGTMQSQVAEINAVRAGADNVFNLELQTGDVARLTLGTDGATFATGSTGDDRFKIDSSGNVGINTGTDSISEKLDVVGNIAVSGTVDGVDVAGLSTTVAGKANLSGADFTGDVGIGALGSPQALGVYGDTVLYSGADVVGDITVTGTVDGRDVAVDGARLDEAKRIPFSQVIGQFITGSSAVTLLTLEIPATTVLSKQAIDFSMSVRRYNSSSDLKKNASFQILVQVMSQSSSGVSLGTATYASSPAAYNAWYYVSGDKTHLISNKRGKFATSSTGSNSSDLLGLYYDVFNDRTYFRISKYPNSISVYSNVEVFYSQSGFLSAGTYVSQTGTKIRYNSLEPQCNTSYDLSMQEILPETTSKSYVRIQFDAVSSITNVSTYVDDFSGHVENLL